MKKRTRFLALLTAGLLCLSFTGCKRLDELKEAHAFWQEGGAILWGDTVYKPLPETEMELNGTPDEKDGYSLTVNVTEKDVPVLLSELEGQYMTPYRDGLFLAGYGTLYCAADRYDEMLELIDQGRSALTKMSYVYSDRNEEKDWIEREYVLTEEQTEAVRTVYESALPYVMEEGMYLSTDRCIDLYAVSENGYFKSLLYNLEVAGNTYYIVEQGMVGNTYRVPDAYASLFASIFAPMIEAEERLYADDWTDDEYGDEWDA